MANIDSQKLSCVHSFSVLVGHIELTRIALFVGQQLMHPVLQRFLWDRILLLAIFIALCSAFIMTVMITLTIMPLRHNVRP
jgi:hypothetical protein